MQCNAHSLDKHHVIEPLPELRKDVPVLVSPDWACRKEVQHQQNTNDATDHKWCDIVMRVGIAFLAASICDLCPVWFTSRT